MLQRLRRLRKTPLLREMVAETRLSKEMFIYPYFITKGKEVVTPIDAMPGINRFSPDTLLRDTEKGLKAGVNKILLFGTGEEKSEDARTSHDENAVVAQTISLLKKQFAYLRFLLKIYLNYQMRYYLYKRLRELLTCRG